MSESGIALRKPCVDCGNHLGTVERKNFQDTVWCSRCHRYQYNAPRTETGLREETVTTVHNGITPGQRKRILFRATGRCELCGNRENLHVGHVLSVDEGLKLGLTASELNDDENLACLCAECNLGMREESVPLRLAAAILKSRVRTVRS